jgi:hypothetical protein
MTESGSWKERQDAFWPGFTVKCDKCGSHEVFLENTMGYSPTSGGWGSIDFVCRECDNRAEIVEA